MTFGNCFLHSVWTFTNTIKYLFWHPNNNLQFFDCHRRLIYAPLFINVKLRHHKMILIIWYYHMQILSVRNKFIAWFDAYSYCRTSDWARCIGFSMFTHHGRRESWFLKLQCKEKRNWKTDLSVWRVIICSTADSLTCLLRSPGLRLHSNTPIS